jgi:hypothetical protein
MLALHHELTVLSRAVNYKNLSVAANHVGLSQPQLSRIVSKLEQELGVILLDRSAKRKSSWTHEALKLAEVYRKNLQRLEADLQQVTLSSRPHMVRMGSLEGLLPFAEEWAKSFLFKLKIPKVQLDVFDYRELEQHFLGGELDLIFTAKSPSLQKFSKQKVLGYQILEKIEKGPLTVLSDYEYSIQPASGKKNMNGPVFISNSLPLRIKWLNELGGTGMLPIASRKKAEAFPVFAIASELFSPSLWQEISGLHPEQKL